MTPELAADLQKFDASFQAWRAKNGNKTFSHFSAARVAKSILAGIPHTTLGPKLTGEHEWWRNGLFFYDFLMQSFPIDLDAVVCDYGCGSLRVGVHVMKRQNAGCYIGLDVVDAFIARGKKIIGPALLQEKAPLLGSIGDKLEEAVARQPDLVFAVNVACHVHPDEEGDFIFNLLALTAKPGARLSLHLSTCDRPVRYARSGWARPLDDYIEMLKPLEFVDASPQIVSQRDAFEITTYLATFVRS